MIMLLFDTVTVYVLLGLFGAFQALFSCCMYGCCAEVTSTGQARYMFMVQSLGDGCASLVAPIITGKWTYCLHLGSSHAEMKQWYCEIEDWRLPPANHTISLVIQSQDTSQCTCFWATGQGNSNFQINTPSASILHITLWLRVYAILSICNIKIWSWPSHGSSLIPTTWIVPALGCSQTYFHQSL